MNKQTHKERAAIRQQMREYKAEGHSASEVAKRFGYTKGYTQQICKGIAPQKGRPQEYKNQYTKDIACRESLAIRMINERTPGFEYVDGFTFCDGSVNLKCKKCGSIITRSLISIRHGNASCNVCRANEQKHLKEKKEAKQKAKREAREYERKTKIIVKSQISMSVCECCGDVFIPYKVGLKYCSEKCRLRKKNTSHADKRRELIQSAYVDDISVERTYKRDNGKCWICGKICDWNDYYINKDGRIITGKSYPSRDHIIPLSKGGKHEWTNIRLACRACNSKKGSKIIPLVSKMA